MYGVLLVCDLNGQPDTPTPCAPFCVPISLPLFTLFCAAKQGPSSFRALFGGDDLAARGFYLKCASCAWSLCDRVYLGRPRVLEFLTCWLVFVCSPMVFGWFLVGFRVCISVRVGLCTNSRHSRTRKHRMPVDLLRLNSFEFAGLRHSQTDELMHGALICVLFVI